jgi:hypothetical protein
MAFIRNAWHVARGPPTWCLARRVLDEPLVLFRAASGACAALASR